MNLRRLIIGGAVLISACSQGPEFGRIDSNNAQHAQTIVLQINEDEINKVKRLMINLALDEKERDPEQVVEVYKLMLQSGVKLNNTKEVQRAVSFTLENMKQQLVDIRKNTIDKYSSQVTSLKAQLSAELAKKEELIARGNKFLARKEELKELYAQALQDKNKAKETISNIGAKLSRPKRASFDAVQHPLDDNFYAYRDKTSKQCHKSWWQVDNKYKAGSASFYLGEYTLDSNTVCGYYMVRKMDYAFQREQEIIGDIRNKYTAQQMRSILHHAKVALRGKFEAKMYEKYFNSPDSDPYNHDTFDVGREWRKGDSVKAMKLRDKIATSQRTLEQTEANVIEQEYVRNELFRYQDKVLEGEPAIVAIYAGLNGKTTPVDAGGRFQVTDLGSSHLIVIKRHNDPRNSEIAVVNLKFFAKREEIVILSSDFVTAKNKFDSFVLEAKRLSEKAANQAIATAKNEATTFLETNKAKEGVVTTDSGLQYEVLISGTGEKPAVEDTVEVHYVGTLTDGTEFDSSVARGEPATFQLNRVIPGWVEGVQLMPVGSKYKFVIPAELAYGEKSTGSIPANSALVFEVELISIVQKDRTTKGKSKAFLETNKAKEGVVTTDSGLQYEVLISGTGEKPAAEDTVEVHYVGTLTDGTEFDSSVARGEPATFPLNRVIPGWVEGVQLMPVGSKYKFVIPAELAYGEKSTGSIPANSALVFEVELISIKR